MIFENNYFKKNLEEQLHMAIVWQIPIIDINMSIPFQNEISILHFCNHFNVAQFTISILKQHHHLIMTNFLNEITRRKSIISVVKISSSMANLFFNNYSHSRISNLACPMNTQSSKLHTCIWEKSKFSHIVAQARSKVINLGKTYKPVIWNSNQLNLIGIKFNIREKLEEDIKQERYILSTHMTLAPFLLFFQNQVVGRAFYPPTSAISFKLHQLEHKSNILTQFLILLPILKPNPSQN